MKGEHKPGYRRPRTGERRRTRQPLGIDRFSEEARGAIQKLRAEGRTWSEIEAASVKFAGQRLPASTLHRWYDLRVGQVQREVMEQAERSRAVAAAFTAKGFEKLPEAVRNALSAQVFALMEAHDAGNRQRFTKELRELGWLLARNRQLDIAAEKVDVERRKLDAMVAKVKGLRQEVEKQKLSPEELQRRLDEIYGIAQATA